MNIVKSHLVNSLLTYIQLLLCISCTFNVIISITAVKQWFNYVISWYYAWPDCSGLIASGELLLPVVTSFIRIEEVHVHVHVH